MNGATARPDAELSMLEAMTDCAYALGMRFGEAAQDEADVDRWLKLSDAFNRAFLSVRMGIRLSITLRAGEPKAAANDARPEAERVEREPSRTAREPDRDRERERDYEPVSLARFLQSLRGLTADARRLPVDGDAVLPQLESLLAEATADLAPAAVSASPAKARYLGSAAPVLNPNPAHPRESGDPGFFR